jgi:hypothetical protein
MSHQLARVIVGERVASVGAETIFHEMKRFVDSKTTLGFALTTLEEVNSWHGRRCSRRRMLRDDRVGHGWSQRSVKLVYVAPVSVFSRYRFGSGWPVSAHWVGLVPRWVRDRMAGSLVGQQSRGLAGGAAQQRSLGKCEKKNRSLACTSVPSKSYYLPIL